MPNPVLPGYPIFQNFVPLNVALTLTIANNNAPGSATGGPAPFAIAPAGAAVPFTAGSVLFYVYAGQTVTVTFDVPFQGFVCNNIAVGGPSNLTYQVEDALWGQA
jgi:hypothetical protein